jgi:hypothetical protein
MADRIPLSSITPDKFYPGVKIGGEDLLNSAAMSQLPVVSDIASGGLAIADALRGDYGSAALNAAGILPGIPALGGMTRLSSKWLKPQTLDEIKQGYANRLKHPVATNDGGRLSGFTDPRNQTTLHGYDKNGEKFTVSAETLDPSTLVSSRDNNKTLGALLDALRKTEN